MSIYLVTYDLIGPGKDYDGLIGALSSFGTCLHALESTWFIKAGSARQIYDIAKPFIDADDDIIVIKVDAEYTAYIDEKASLWLRAELGL